MTHFDETFCRACGQTYPNCTCSRREAAFRQGVQLGKVEAQQQIEQAERDRDAAADLAREEAARIAGVYGTADAAKRIRSTIADPAAVKRTMEDAANWRRFVTWLAEHKLEIAAGIKAANEMETDAARKGEEGK